MTSNVIEKEIERGVRNFIEYLKSDRGLDISAVIPNIDDFMQLQHDARSIKLDNDSFIHVCEFLLPGDIISFTTTCNKFMKHYPYIWGIIQNYYFPDSLIPKTDYINIRRSISLDWYYHMIVECGMESFELYEISNCEKTMRQLSAKIHELTPSSVNFRISLITHRAELRSAKNERDKYIDYMGEESMYDFLKEYQFNSMTDVNGIKYYTIKPDIDCRIYSLDPVTDAVETKTKRLWVTGEYNENTDDEFDSGDDEDPEFIYRYTMPYMGNTVRNRIRPDYC